MWALTGNTAQIKLHTVQFIPNIAQFTLNTAHSIIHTAYFIQHTANFIHQTEHYTLNRHFTYKRPSVYVVGYKARKARKLLAATLCFHIVVCSEFNLKYIENNLLSILLACIDAIGAKGAIVIL